MLGKTGYDVKRQLVRLLQKWLINPMVRGRAGSEGYRYALLETTGRRSDEARQTPVGYGLTGNALWIVAEHGQGAAYVRNLEANPRVRIKFGGVWRTGTAHVVPDDDPIERLSSYDQRTAGEVKRFGTSLLTIRVDLDGISAKGATGRM